MSIIQIVMSSGVLSLLTSPNPISLSGVRGGTLTTNVTATPSTVGGTYNWTWAAGGAGITITNATAQTCTISSTTTLGALPITRTGTLRCTYTLVGLTTQNDVNVSLTFEAI